MENNKNPQILDRNVLTSQQNSLGSLVAKGKNPSVSSSNYAQELLDSIHTESFTNFQQGDNKPFFSTNFRTTTFSPALCSQGGLFVQSEEELGRKAWQILVESKGVKHGTGKLC